MVGLRVRAMAPDAVDRDSYDLSVIALELGQDFTEQRELIATHRAPIRGIKYEDDRSAPQLGECQFFISALR